MPREGLATGERRRVAVGAGDVDHDRPLDELRQGPGDRGVEPPDGLRAAEDQHDPVARRDVELDTGGLAVDRLDVADRGAGDETRPVTDRGGKRTAGRLERHRHHVGESRGQAHGTTRDDVAVPQDDRDAQRSGGHQDRDRDIAAGREDRCWPLAGQDRRGLRDGRGQADGVRDRVHAAVHGAQRAQHETVQRDAGRGHERRLEPTPAADPAELGRTAVPGLSRAERPGDGQRRVDMSARAPARDQQSHRRSRFPS